MRYKTRRRAKVKLMQTLLKTCEVIIVVCLRRSSDIKNIEYIDLRVSLTLIGTSVEGR